MEEEEGDGEALSTPFWVQRTTDLRRVDRIRHGVSALIFSSGLVVLLLLVTAVFFLVFILPKTLSLSAQIFRPNSVKKSWDSLNLVLVLVALVFGFISRNKNNNDDGHSPSSSSSYYKEFRDSPMKQNEAQIYKASPRQRSDLSTSKEWDGTYSDYNNPRLETSGRVSDQGKIHRRHRSLEQVDNPRTVPHNKTDVIDTLLSKYDKDAKFPAADRKSPPAHPPSQPPEKEKQEQLEYQRVAHKREKSSRKLKREVEPVTTIPPPMNSEPPLTEEEEGGDGGRKRGGATKDFLNSLYHKKKNKKQRQRSVEKLEMDSLVHDTQLPLSLHVPPPLSPAKPPSPVLKNLFSLTKHKRKKTITVSLKSSSAARDAKPTSQSFRKAKTAPQVSSSVTHKLPKHKMMSLFDNLDEISNSGGESPFNRIPPAPPPPPPGFIKSPSWKFVVRGDYVRVNSSTSSRSDSPEIDDLESDFGGDNTTPFRGSSPLFYPSPNVDTKAESFISSFRAKLKLEKMHSIKKREVGLSGLGPRSGPSQI